MFPYMMPYAPYDMSRGYQQTRNGEGFEKKIITVEGIGKVTAQPDVAVLTIGVLTEDSSAKVAQRKNTKIMNQVIKELEKQGVDSEDIQTIGYYVDPRYDYIDGKQVFRAYEVRHIIRVTVRDIEKVGVINEAAIEAGANVQQGIRFTVMEPEKYYQAALDEAVLGGKRKAKRIAQTMQLVIEENPIVIEEKSTGPENRVYMDGYTMKAAAPIQPGTFDVVARVKEVFEMME